MRLLKNTPGFFEGLVIALIFSVLLTATVVVIGGYFFGSDIFRLLLAGITFGYIIYLLVRSGQRTGRFTVMFTSATLSLLALVVIDSFFLFLMVHMAMVWMVRSLYFYKNIFQSLADLLLMSAAVLSAGWTWASTGSLFLTSWCFFITQALFIYIPGLISFKPTAQSTINNSTANYEDDQFERAFQLAEQASERLIKSGINLANN